MKKIFIALITLTLVFGLSATAFATDGDQNTYQWKTQKHIGEIRTTPPAISNMWTTHPAIRTMKTTPPAFGLNLAAKTTLAALRADIKDNREVIKEDRDKIKEILASIKEEIKALKDSGTALNEEQIATIRTSLQAIKTDRKAYNEEHKSIIEEQRHMIKVAHGTKDFTAAIAAMEKIKAEQMLRINDLEHIYQQLDLLSKNL
jgi:hypothetical protein